MAYLQKLLLVFLVLSTLGYSSAWAFDEHVLEQLETESTFLNTNADDLLHVGSSQDEHEAGDIACDHCCHIFSHLVAIFSDVSSTTTSGTSTYLSSMSEDVNSFIPGPDRKPPRH